MSEPMSQNDKIWKINNLSLELDLADADVVERYEKAFGKMSSAEQAIPKDGKTSERIRAACKIFYDLFVGIFGEETADKIFKGVPTSIPSYMKIYEDFLAFATAQRDKNRDYLAGVITKYTPNRQQRRTQQRRSKKK